MSDQIRVLLIEDNPDDAELVLMELGRGGFQVVSARVDTASELETALASGPWDVVISDFSMPRFSGRAALELVRAADAEVPFIMLSGTIGEDSAVDSMRAGANDYLMKTNTVRLVPAVRRELREAAGRRERGRLQEQLRQSQKMEAVGRLAGGVAHDFNNLLTAIIGYAEVVHRKLPAENPLRADVEEIVRAGERAASLTKQLLAFSRRQVLLPRIVDLNAIVTNLERMLRRLIGEDIELATALDPDVPPIKADPSQLEQVILNLVVNAREAMPDGGRLTLATARAPMVDAAGVDSKPTGAWAAQLTVSDSGTGIPPETIPRIFEPFFTTKQEGTGLGLATVYGIVSQSDGVIRVRSAPGKGTAFEVLFPQVNEVAPAPEPPPPEVSGGKETILLVEDEHAVRTLARRILETRGYRVHEASRPDEALVIHRRGEPIDLMVCDVVMPGGNGVDLAREITRERPGLKVLFVSGYTDLGPARDAFASGEAPLLPKPFSPDDLARRVRSLLDGR